MAAWKILVSVLLGLSLAAPMAYWLGGGELAQFGYRPPPLAAGRLEAVSAEATARGVRLGSPKPFREFLGYRDRTQINVYRGEWDATRDGQPVVVSIKAEARHGKWMVTQWNER